MEKAVFFKKILLFSEKSGVCSSLLVISLQKGVDFFITIIILLSAWRPVWDSQRDEWAFKQGEQTTDHSAEDSGS